MNRRPAPVARGPSDAIRASERVSPANVRLPGPRSAGACPPRAFGKVRVFHKSLNVAMTDPALR